MPQDTAPATHPNLTTRTTGNPDMVGNTRRAHSLRSRIPGHIRSRQSLDPVLSMARPTRTIPRTMCRTRSPIIPAACRWCRHSLSIAHRVTLRTALLVEAPTLHPPTELKNRHTSRNTPFPSHMMPLLVARRMDPPARPRSWALPPAKLQCTTASMSPSPSTIIRLPLLPAQLRLPVHRLKRDIVEVHIHAAATASGTARTDLVADKESRR